MGPICCLFGSFLAKHRRPILQEILILGRSDDEKRRPKQASLARKGRTINPKQIFSCFRSKHRSPAKPGPLIIRRPLRSFRMVYRRKWTNDLRGHQFRMRVLWGAGVGRRLTECLWSIWGLSNIERSTKPLCLSVPSSFPHWGRLGQPAQPPPKFYFRSTPDSLK